VIIKPPQIVSFTATPAQIVAGQCATLSWEVQSAVRAVLAPGLGEVALTGLRLVCPATTATCNLTAFGSDSQSATRNVDLIVTPIPF
jgi:hypothetical protein